MRHPRRNPPRTGAEGALLAGVTYAVVSHESAARGDVEDAGWEHEMLPMRFRHAADIVSQYRPYDGEPQDNGDELIFRGVQAHVDFRTGDETNWDVIVRGDRVTLNRLLAWYRHFTRASGRR